MPVLLFGEAIWRWKGLSILGRTYNFLISFVRRSNFFLLKQILSVLKFTLTLCNCASILLLQLKIFLLSFFFFVFPCISMNIYATCTTDQMVAIWTKSNLSIFSKRLFIWLTHLHSSLSINIGDCWVKSNQWGAATAIFSISLNDYSKLFLGYIPKVEFRQTINT